MSGNHKAAFEHNDAVPLRDIFLWHENPRHQKVNKEGEAIEILCEDEDVLAMAGDIVHQGTTSPLEQIALVPMAGPKSTTTLYYVVEGNRRVCALKLLADPDKAPPRFRKAFEDLAASWSNLATVRAVIFRSEKEARPWLERAHGGAQGGIGRKNWDSEQKQRFTGVEKNKVAQDILDYAERKNMITAEERSRKLTTAQRYLNNQIFRESLGLDRSPDGHLRQTRSTPDFDKVLHKFVRDLVEGKEVTSRKNKNDIVEYGRALNMVPGLTGDRISAQPLGFTAPNLRQPPRPRAKPKPIEIPSSIEYDPEIGKALTHLGNFKLNHLYHSLCTVELEKHVLLVSVGVWAFFETLTAVLGRRENDSFSNFLQPNKLDSLGVARRKAHAEALGRLSAYGNTTKHDAGAATFNGAQLYSDMETLRGVVLACLKAATSS